jgi:hypothetical protein
MTHNSLRLKETNERGPSRNIPGLSVPLSGIVNLIREMKSIAEVWHRKMLMGHGRWGETCGVLSEFRRRLGLAIVDKVC